MANTRGDKLAAEVTLLEDLAMRLYAQTYADGVVMDEKLKAEMAIFAANIFFDELEKTNEDE